MGGGLIESETRPLFTSNIYLLLLFLFDSKWRLTVIYHNFFFTGILNLTKLILIFFLICSSKLYLRQMYSRRTRNSIALAIHKKWEFQLHPRTMVLITVVLGSIPLHVNRIPRHQNPRPKITWP